jgi:methylthioribose-1-phosphate isomerase
VYLTAKTPSETAKAIKDMATRGAPLIGCAGAYGYALALTSANPASWKETEKLLDGAALTLRHARPTAVALMYAVDRMHGLAKTLLKHNKTLPFSRAAAAKLARALNAEADKIHDEDVAANDALSEKGAKLFPKNSVVMTICNAGALATAGIGTALGVIYKARAKGKIKHVYACETRPYLQGARLTMFELIRNKIPCTLLTDNMAAHIMKTCRVNAVIAGADRIAANGDTANKIGTYGLAVLAKHHNVPFYIAAPMPTIDYSLPDGGHIPIEERCSREVTWVGKTSIAPKGAKARHPAFDVTPAGLITAIITENGIAARPDRKKMSKLLR